MALPKRKLSEVNLFVRILANTGVGFGVIGDLASDIFYQTTYDFPTYWVAVANTDGTVFRQQYTNFMEYAATKPDEFQCILKAPASYGLRTLFLYRKAPSPNPIITLPNIANEAPDADKLQQVQRHGICNCCGMSHTDLRPILRGCISQLFVTEIPKSTIVQDFLYKNSKEVAVLDGLMLIKELKIVYPDVLRDAIAASDKVPWHRNAMPSLEDISEFTTEVIHKVWKVSDAV